MISGGSICSTKAVSFSASQLSAIPSRSRKAQSPYHLAVHTRAVIPRDKQVDALNKQLHHELASFMVEKPNTISRCLNLMVISKSIERIADHATNVAEEVVYLYEGRDIRHTGKAAATEEVLYSV